MSTRSGHRIGRSSKKQQKLDWIDKFVIFIFSWAFIHWLVEEIRCFIIPGAIENSSLTMAVFGLCGGEAIILYLIYKFKKNKKIKEGKNE